MTGHLVTDDQVRHAGHDGSADSQRRGDDQIYTAVGEGQRVNGLSGVEAQSSHAADALVLIAADVLDDLERTRIATENRLRSLTHEPVEGERGGWFGKGLDPDMPEVRRVEAILEGLRTLEHQAELDLCRAMRKHPLGDWVKRTVGVGEKQAARLLAAIGNPASRRTVSQLWAYCGYHVLNPGQTLAETQGRDAGDPTVQGPVDTQESLVGGEDRDPGHGLHDAQDRLAGVAPKRRKGTKANWSSIAKMRAWLIAESCVKQTGTGGAKDAADPKESTRRRSPYRSVYDAGREKYAEAVHAHSCERCGPSGKPAAVGSPLSDGHKHARAMRLVAKAILRDLWIEARQVIDRPESIDVAAILAPKIKARRERLAAEAAEREQAS